MFLNEILGYEYRSVPFYSSRFFSIVYYIALPNPYPEESVMRKKVINFTQVRIRQLPVPDSGRVEYYDTEIQKLMCRVSASGNKSFAVVKWKDGKARRVTLGNANEISVSEARKLALEALSQLNKGIDPTADRKKKFANKSTLREVLEHYLAHRKLKQSTIDDYRYKLKLGFQSWLDQPIYIITEKDIIERYKWITDHKGETTANTTCRVLRLTLNYAVVLGLIQSSPIDVLSKARMWHRNNRCQRLIASDNLADWYDAVEALSNIKAKTYLLTLLYLGLRRTEALLMEWANIDFSAELLTLRPDQTKNKQWHKIPIPPVLLMHLKNTYKETGKSKWVFSSINGDGPMSMPQKHLNKVSLQTGIKFSPHDLRRTFATIAEGVGMPLTVIKRLLNHTTNQDVTGGYIITQEETLRRAVLAISNDISDRVIKELSCD